jgi:hypothetical protein
MDAVNRMLTVDVRAGGRSGSFPEDRASGGARSPGSAKFSIFPEGYLFSKVREILSTRTSELRLAEFEHQRG